MEHYIDQTERLVTINKLLPELERFLRITLTNEQLSDKANTQREEFLAKLEALNKPPRLPPRPPVNHAGFSATTDYLSKQREISWMQNDPKRSATPPGAPYRSRRRQPSDDIGAIAANFHDGSSTSEDSNLLYAKIPNETGSDKYVDIEGLASNNKPPVPDRSPRVSLLKPATDDREPKRNSWKTNTNEIFLHNLENPTRSGPLTNIRTKTRLWCVLKKKNLYVFRDIQQPCDHIIDVMNHDIHVESSTSSQFRLSKPGSPSFSLAAEDSEDHRRWVEALENCKYVDIDSEMPPRSSGHGNNLIEDPAYEEPRDVIDKMKKNEMDAPKSPNDLYVDMNGSKRKPSDDYVDPSLHTPPLYHKLADLEYDAELPPMPLSSDEEVRGDDDAIVEEPRKFPQEQSSDGNISGSFQSYSSSEDEPPPLPKIKPRSSSVPPSYSVNNQSVNSLERKKSSSLGRKLEKDAFFNDATAVHIGVLHQRRFLAVGKKRYCKVKNEVMYVYRNPDNDEKPVLEVALHDVKVDPCEKETWKSNSFKIVQPTGETVYFAAETREELIHWLKVLVQEADKTKFSGKDQHMRFPSKSLLYPGDTIDSASNSSLERKDGAEDSEDTSLDSAATGSEASDEETSNSTRRKSLKKRKPFEKSPSQKKRAERDVDLDGYLHLERAGKWIRFWCKIKAKILEIHSSKSSKSAENTIAMAELNIVTLPKKVMEETNYFLFKLIWAEESLLFLARDMFEWKKWNEALKKFTKGKTENLELHLGLPNLPAPHRKDERDARSKKKKPVKNGHLKPIDVADTPQERKQFRGTLKRLKDEADNAGVDVFCDARDGFFVLASDVLLEKKLMEVPVRKIKLHQKKLVVKDDRYIFEIQATNDSLALLAVKEEREFIQLVEVLWLLNAQVDGERGTIANTHVNKLKKQYKRRSIAFDSELIALETGDRSAFSKQRENIIGRPEKSISDDEHKRKTLKTPVKTDSKRPMKTSSSGKQSGGSRMSSLFKSLPRLRQKKYEFNAGDSVDGVPKIQFSGNVQEVKANEEGAEQLLDRHCKVSGKIFYAYEPGSELKPIFKVPLRNAVVEEIIEKEANKFGFILSSMEDRASFKFLVFTEEEFDNCSNALYLNESKSVPGRMSSRESLLDESKSDADTDAKAEGAFPGSNSNSSISSMLSKQARSMAGNGDETNTTVPARKISEDVFTGSADDVLYSGFLYEVKINESNGIKSRTKIRRWCSLKQSWIEIYNNKNDKVPIRGVAVQHHTFDNLSAEDSGEKWALSLKADNEVLVLCANGEEDFNKWQQMFRKVAKRSSRKASDTARLKLKSAGEGIRQLLSSSSLPGSSKRDSKRSTIVLDDDDKKVVDTFTKDMESGSKISGVLMIMAVNDKPSKPKKRFCVIRDGKFCIAKRSKPQKAIQTIELSSIGILDECDIDKAIFRFRLDFGQNESLVFQAEDQPTADNWMVAISMGILLERLTSPEKFPQQGESGSDNGAEAQHGDLETNDLGLVDVSPVIGGDTPGSKNSNLSNDIKVAIDRKISGGSNYLHPLSDLLESAFTPGPYSESSTPSSREGTLERNLRGKTGPRSSSGEAIMEEEREDSDDVDSQKQEVRRGENAYDGSKVASGEENNGLPKPGSVTEAISVFEKMAPNTKEHNDDNVFSQNTEHSEAENELKALLKTQDDLQEEKATILSCVADLENNVETSRARMETGSETQEFHLYEEEYNTAKNDLEAMQNRLNGVNKSLLDVVAEIKTKYSKATNPFRKRSAVISSHVIV